MHPRFGELGWATPYGAMLVVALLACWWYARRRAVGRGIDPSHVDLAIPAVFAAAVLGAQVLATAGFAEFSVGGDLLGPHRRSRVFVLLPLAALGLLVYARLTSESFRSFADLLALPALLWLAVVRIGCFLAGCCWGDVAVPLAGVGGNLTPEAARQLQTLPALAAPSIGIRFPAGSFAFEQHVAAGLLDVGATGSLPVHATQLYELTLLLLLLAVLLRLEARWPHASRPRGRIAVTALAGYAALRFGLEFLRADNTPIVGMLTSVQIFCVAALCATVIAWRLRWQ